MALAGDGGGATLTDLARRLGIHKSSAHSILAVLLRRRFVERDRTSRRYRLGAAVLGLGRAALAAEDLEAIARPHLARLCRLSGETATLHLRDGAASVIAASQESPRQLKVSAPVGHRLPAFAGSVGKVLAAFAPPDHPLPAALPRFTSRSIRDRRRFRRELLRIRRAGVALDAGEYLAGVCAISAPVFFGSDATAAAGALSVVAVRARISGASLRRLARPLRSAARALSAALSPAVQIDRGHGGAPTHGEWRAPVPAGRRWR